MAKIKNIKNGTKISGDPATGIKKTSREVFAGLKVGTYIYPNKKKTLDRDKKHKGRDQYAY